MIAPLFAMTHKFPCWIHKNTRLKQYDKDWLGCEAFYIGNSGDTSLSVEICVRDSMLALCLL